MVDIPDYTVPILAGLFIVLTAIVGFCLYWYHLKTRKIQEENNGKHRHEGQSKCTKVSSFKLNSNPFIFYMGPVPLEFCTTSCTDEGIESSRSLQSPCHFRQEQPCVKPPEKKRVCTRTSSEISPKSSCHMQVIVEEEIEEMDKGKINV